MDTLFTEMENERKSEVAPLAVRMRPRTLEEVVGQDEAVGPGLSLIHILMMLTAKGTEFDTVSGLDAGADDYLAKPFGMMELVSRCLLYTSRCV